MRIHDPKLRNMTHALSLRFFIAFKGTNFSILFTDILKSVIVIFVLYVSEKFLKRTDPTLCPTDRIGKHITDDSKREIYNRCTVMARSVKNR